jgi:sulfite reductase alpha subunit-like flavoprotein
MGTRITILIGTMTGTAQLCAQEMELALDDGATQIEALLMDNLDASVFERESAFLICTSTYGQGDVPDNARALYEDRTFRSCATECLVWATGLTRRLSTTAGSASMTFLPSSARSV